MFGDNYDSSDEKTHGKQGVEGQSDRDVVNL